MTVSVGSQADQVWLGSVVLELTEAGVEEEVHWDQELAESEVLLVLETGFELVRGAEGSQEPQFEAAWLGVDTDDSAGLEKVASSLDEPVESAETEPRRRAAPATVVVLMVITCKGAYYVYVDIFPYSEMNARERSDAVVGEGGSER